MNERDDNLIEVEERLARSRPIPSAGFRGELRRHLISGRPEEPSGVRRLVAVYATSGCALLLIAAIGVAGAGPLAA